MCSLNISQGYLRLEVSTLFTGLDLALKDRIFLILNLMKSSKCTFVLKDFALWVNVIFIFVLSFILQLNVTCNKMTVCVRLIYNGIILAMFNVLEALLITNVAVNMMWNIMND